MKIIMRILTTAIIVMALAITNAHAQLSVVGIEDNQQYIVVSFPEANKSVFISVEVGLGMNRWKGVMDENNKPIKFESVASAMNYCFAFGYRFKSFLYQIQGVNVYLFERKEE